MQSFDLESSLESLSLQPFLQSLHKEQWQEVRLGEVAEITSSKRIFYSEYVEYGIPFYRSKEIIEFSKGNNPQNELFIDENKYNDIANKFGVPQANDILLTSVGTLGIPYLVPKDKKFYFKDGNLTWFKNFKNITSLFLFYWFKSPQGKEKLDSIAIGSTQQALTIQGMKNLIFLLPPLTIQQKIAEILSSFDDKIDLLHRQNKTLESLALTLFRHYFIDNPKRDEWEEKPLSEIAEIQNGYAFKNSDYTERGMETYEVLKMGHIESGGGLRYFPKAHYVKINDKMTKWVLNEDDIVLAMTDMKDSLGILGYPAMVDKSNYYVLNQRVARIYLKSKDDFLHNYFLFLYLSLQENIQKLQSLANGGVQVNLSTEAIKNFTITIPPLEFQSQNNQAFINIIKKYKNNRKQIQNLQAMRDIILKAIFGAK